MEMLRYAAMALLLGTLLGVNPASAGVVYSNGFESDTAGWDAFGGAFNATRVPSGTNGITSASGGFHAQNSATGSAGNWGGYNFGAGSVPTVFQEYWTSLDIYLDVDGGWANDTRFDFSSAISNSAGTHRRDFIFNAGFYNDATGTGAGTDRFVISASNNSQPGSAFAKNPGKDPIAISTSGWYTFEHHFYDNAGLLAVDMSIFDAADSLVHTWTLSDAADLIGLIGGNRYGWFDYNQFSVLAFDNTELRTADVAAVPEPASLAVWGVGALSIALGAARRRRQKLAA
ncbi:MAG: PEP-CTERM sorting domain-containing protein [Planctomycetes bacterium]|nr:PEP-CTERM sorting domain-containing protein [Planctomycetota bacterium]